LSKRRVAQVLINWREPIEEFIECDRIVSDADAGGVIDRVRNRRRNAA
jgi:hypothetical protein